MNKKRLDALLLHTYWYDINKKGKLDICNKIQVLALANILNKYEIGSVVLTGGNVSKNDNSISADIREWLLNALPISYRDKILISAKSKTTIGEIKEYKILAKKYDWQSLGSLGLALHIPRIKRDFEKYFKIGAEVKFFIADENVSQKDRQLLQEYKDSRARQILERNEYFIRTVEKVPVIGTLFLEILGTIFVNKGFYQPKIIDFFLKTKSKL